MLLAVRGVVRGEWIISQCYGEWLATNSIVNFEFFHKGLVKKLLSPRDGSCSTYLRCELGARGIENLTGLTPNGNIARSYVSPRGVRMACSRMTRVTQGERLLGYPTLGKWRLCFNWVAQNQQRIRSSPATTGVLLRRSSLEIDSLDETESQALLLLKMAI